MVNAIFIVKPLKVKVKVYAWLTFWSFSFKSIVVVYGKQSDKVSQCRNITGLAVTNDTWAILDVFDFLE